MIDNSLFSKALHSKKKKASRKVKIEFTDQEGSKYCFTVEKPSKQNMTKIMDFVQTMSNTESQNEERVTEEQAPIDTNFARVYGLIETKFRLGSFNSTDVLEAYEDEFQLPTTLSTISTYLARLAERELLTRSRNGAGWTYRLIRIEQQQLHESAKSIQDREQSTITNLIP